MQPEAVGATESRTVDELAPGSLCDAVEPLNGHEAFGETDGAGTVVGVPLLALFELDPHDEAPIPMASTKAIDAIGVARMIPPGRDTRQMRRV